MKQSEIIQSYFDDIYKPFVAEIKEPISSKLNEIYGELYYYSLEKLLPYLKITENDHFLDIGSGFGKVVFQVFLTTNALSVTGIEINKQRCTISQQVKIKIKQQIPDAFNNRHLNLWQDDFLEHDFLNPINIIYVCSAIFSLDLLTAMEAKINNMNTVQKVVSFRKLPNLHHFIITQKLFLHTTWDKAACYIYSRSK